MKNKLLIWSLRAIVPLAVIAAGFAGKNYLTSNKPEAPERKAREKVWPVRATTVKFTDHQPKLRLFGNTVAGRKVDLRALVAGQVVDTGPNLKEGARVKKGDLLIKIDPFQYEGAVTEARANLAEARAKRAEYVAQTTREKEVVTRAKEQLDISIRDLERAIPLVKRGAISTQIEDQRRLTVSQRRQALEQANSNLTMQEARLVQQEAAIDRLDWRLKDSKRKLQESELRAPFDAYILNVGAEKGRLVGASDRVVTLIDTNWVDVTFTLSDKQYGRILAAESTIIGRELLVNWRVGDKPITYKAKIERVNAEINAADGGITLFARIENPNEPIPIRSGAFVELLVADKKYSRVAIVPRTALYPDNQVFIVNNNRLAPRKVSVIGASENKLFIRGKISEGDQIVTTRLSSAGEGVKVKILTETPSKNKNKFPESSNTNTAAAEKTNASSVKQ